MTWFVAGGFPMVFIAVFGAIALFGAARYALVGGPLSPVIAYAAAVVFVSLAGVALDLSFVTRSIGSFEGEIDPLQLVRIGVVGVGESLSPVVLGFAVTGVVSLLAAVGLRRHG